MFRDDLGEPASVEELEALSGKKRRASLDAIKDACQAFIAGPAPGLPRGAADAMTAARFQRIATASSSTRQTPTSRRCSSGTRP